jgi:hypothetical protein
MFGGAYGAFRSHDAHFFSEQSPVYQQLTSLVAIRASELVLRRGRQYLREISGDGVGFGYPVIIGGGRMESVIAWSRIFNNVEIVCGINTDVDSARGVWVTVDSTIHAAGDVLAKIFPVDGSGDSVNVEFKDERTVVFLTVAKAGFVLFK